MIFTFIRHLPTEWNIKGYLQGRKDISIYIPSIDQLEQILQNKEKINSYIKPSVILCSSLKRTYQTALYYGYEPKIEHLLDEWNFGKFEGQPKIRLIMKYGDKWTNNPVNITLGESGKNLQKRVNSFLKKYQHYEHVLVFGHGAWIRACLSLIDQKDINKMNQITLANNECLTVNFIREEEN